MAPMRALFAALFAVAALAACSPQPAEVDPVAQVPADQRPETEGATEGGAGEDGGAATWVAVDIAYEEAPAEVAAGEVEVELVNNGAAVHDVTFDGLDQTVVTAPGGTTEVGTVTLEPGTYTYYCSIPGHREAGMEGELTVS